MIFIVIFYLFITVTITQIKTQKLKWNVGSFLMNKENSNFNLRITKFEKYLPSKLFRGFSFQFAWDKLQPTSKNDPLVTTEIMEFCNRINTYNEDNPTNKKSMFLTIVHTNFNPSCTRPPIPPDVNYQKTTQGKCIHENECFEGVEVGETALSGDSPYTQEKWKDELIRLSSIVTPKMKYSRVSQKINFLGGTSDLGNISPTDTYEEACVSAPNSLGRYLCKIVDKMLEIGTSMGHPDTFVESNGGGIVYSPGHHIEHRIKGRIPMTPNLQTATLTEYDVEEAMFRKAISELHANYLIWTSDYSGNCPVRSLDRSGWVDNYVVPTLEKVETMIDCHTKEQANTLTSGEKTACDDTHSQLKNKLTVLHQSSQNYMNQFQTDTYYDWTYQNIKVPDITCSKIPKNTNCDLCKCNTPFQDFVESGKLHIVIGVTLGVIICVLLILIILTIIGCLDEE